MNEEEWLTWDLDVKPLLYYCEDDEGKCSPRKLRLFAVACCRDIWHLLRDEMSQRAVEAAEGFADGQTTLEALRALRSAAEKARHSAEPGALGRGADGAQGAASREDMLAFDMAWLVEEITQEAFFYRYMAQDVSDGVAALAIHSAIPEQMGNTAEGDSISERVNADLRPKHCDLVREIFGNPFCPVAFNPAWRTPPTLSLAHAAYEERRFEDLPLLADALEEAGCTDEATLSHLRGPGPHVRGCWALDLVLGRS
jgi:hypothetical protein